MSSHHVQNVTNKKRTVARGLDSSVSQGKDEQSVISCYSPRHAHPGEHMMAACVSVCYFLNTPNTCDPNRGGPGIMYDASYTKSAIRPFGQSVSYRIPSVSADR